MRSWVCQLSGFDFDYRGRKKCVLGCSDTEIIDIGVGLLIFVSGM